MTTSTTEPGRHALHEAYRAVHFRLLGRVLATTVVVLVFAATVGAVLGVALVKAIDLAVATL